MKRKEMEIKKEVNSDELENNVESILANEKQNENTTNEPENR